MYVLSFVDVVVSVVTSLVAVTVTAAILAIVVLDIQMHNDTWMCYHLPMVEINNHLGLDG